MKNISGVLAAVFLPLISVAQTAGQESKSTYMSNGVFLVLVAAIILLLLVIVALLEMLKASATHHNRRKKNEGSTGSKTAALVFFMLVSTSLLAQQQAEVPAEAVAPPFDYWGLGAMMFYILVSIIFCEGIIIYVLYRMAMLLLRVKEPEPLGPDAPLWGFRILKSVTKVQTPEEEAAIMTDHEYDGIRELDNNLPLWWKYGFYFTIIVGVVYMFNYHVIGSGLSSEEEYQQELADADAQLQEYKKTHAQMVDENTVTLLTDAASLSAGRGIYTQNCAACHGPQGGGLVGPNLTDVNWIHGGGVVNVFKSVKYGWTDKGMKSWQQDLSSLDIQKVASYILSLQGTNPPNAKAPEGEVYVEQTVTDSAAVATDSIQAVQDTVKNK